MRRRRISFEFFKVVYRNERGEPRVTVVGYSEDGANDEADRMEDAGTEILDVVSCKPGTPHEDIERMYE